MNANTHRRLERIEGKLRSEAPALSEHFITIVVEDDEEEARLIKSETQAAIENGTVKHADEIGFLVMRIVDPKPQPAQEIRIPTHRPQVDRSDQEIAAALMAERHEPGAAPARRPGKMIRTTMTMDEFAPLGSGRGTIRVM